MNVNKPKNGGTPEPAKPVPPFVTQSPPPPIKPLFRSIDWFAFGVTSLLVFLGYLWTLAPDLTLEDSGELAVASMYGGVPHPPGYPVWTIFTWLFTQLPISNIAYRVGISSAFAGALACGLVALMVSRGSSMIIEGVADLRSIARNIENWICIVAGFVAGMLTGFNGFMWSQSVIVEVYTLSVLSLAGVLVCLMRWIYAPHQNRYLYLAFFLFGICFNNHQSLLVVALGLEVAIVAVRPALGRDLLFWNTLIYLGGLVMRQMGLLNVLTDNTPLFIIYNLIGVVSLIAWVYLSFRTRKRGLEFARDFTMVGMIGYLLGVFAHITNYTTAFEYKTGLFVFFNVVGLAMAAAFVYLTILTRNWGREWLGALASGGAWTLGAAFYLYMPIASMSNPPLNWGYPRIVSGFFHAFTRGQYERIHPTTNIVNFFKQIVMYFQGAVDEFNLVYLLVAVIPFFFWKRMEKRERSWLTGLTATYVCLSLFLLILLNPGTDRQSRDLNKVFFTASHVMIAMGVGYGLTFITGMLLVNFERWRRWIFLGGLVAAGIGAVNLAISYINVANPLVHYTAIFVMLLPLAIAALMFMSPARAPWKALLALFAIMPLWSIMAHWEENEQRGHLFGYWFGHDMFTPPFDIYPEMTRDAVLYGGTDPGRFNPTYMIFCESFIPPSKKRDPKFDRRDVYLITQNALADGTYLNYIRAHYNRSTQYDPGFFSELLRGPKEIQENKHTNVFARMMLPVDDFFLDLGDKIEKSRRAGTSFFKPQDFTGFKEFVARLKPGPQQDPLSKFLYEKLGKRTQELVTRGGSESALRKALAEDLNRLLNNELTERRKMDDEILDIDYSNRLPAEKDQLKHARVNKYRAENHQLYHPDRFQHVKISERTMQFMEENPPGHSLIRLNRILLEEAYPGLIAKSIGGVYPDREIKTATPEDSQRCFHEYLEDAQRRLQLKQLRPGEDVKVIDNRVQVSGQVAVMAINGLLTKVMFDKNPGHEFFVEESFPLDWMYPHLSPFGIIMKINRNPLPELTEEMVAKDHEFWSKYSQRAIGNWITYDTSISNICAFAEKVYYRRDYREFKGDPKFIRDSDGQKAFSKLRSSIAGVYAWRVQKVAGEVQKAAGENNAAEYQKKNAEYQRMLREADFAFKQAYAFCPYSPEAIFRYINLLVSIGRIEDARLIATTSYQLDPANSQMDNLILELNRIGGSQRSALPLEQPVAAAPVDQNTQVARLEAAVKQNPSNLQAVYQLGMAYVQAQQPDKALAVADRLLNDPRADNTSLLYVAQICHQMNSLPRVEQALTRLAKSSPETPEVWFDLAAVQARQQKETQAIDSLRMAMEGSDKRRAKDPNAPNLHSNALTDPTFNSIRQSPAFQRIVASNRTAGL